jgi:hypothetical protein
MRSDVAGVMMRIKNLLFWVLCVSCFLVHSGTEPLAVASGYNSSDLAQSGIRQPCLPVEPARYRGRFRNHAQRKRPVKPAPKTTAPPVSELIQLRDSYIKTTKEYKASLQKLLALYEASEHKAEQRLAQSKDLYQDGLLSKKQVEESERALTIEKEKVSGVEQQIASADTQIAETLIEIEGDKQIAKIGRLAKGRLVQTSSFIRFNGASGFVLSNAGKIQNFFLQKFSRPLPIAVFGQGAIHDRWRLDHHNAMDISLSPDGPEGQALMEFLRTNGIPFSAFRGAIPGVATGPHIHIGLPSHRY